MKIRVEYAAQVKRTAGTGSEDVEVNETPTVANVVRAVASKHGGGLAEMLLDADGQVQRSLLLFVDDEQIRSDDGRSLAESGRVLIMSPISGG